MIVTLDTTFFVMHYFSKEESLLSKTRRILYTCRKLGSRGVLPTIVLGEFYALTHKKAGRDVAEKRFNELVNSGLSIVELTAEISKQAAIFRRKYEEKIPWEDCIIAATSFLRKAQVVVTEDPHFKQIKEIKAKTLDEVRV
jgi:predicted nucleic acid-binding protein